VPKKQFSFAIDALVALRLRDEAIRRGLTPSGLIQAWLAPHLRELPAAASEQTPNHAQHSRRT
jgi:hypothetical protein